MKLFETEQDTYVSTAKVVDNTLVLSLPDAKSPVVWRMDLSEIKSASFEVQQEEDVYLLLMKTPKGTAQKIAPFESKEGAMKALMATSHAMEQAGQKKLAPANDKYIVDAKFSEQKQKNSKSNPLLMSIIGIALLIGLLFIMTKTGPRTPTSLGGSSAPVATSQKSGDEGGVPMTADDFLKNR